MGDSVYLYNVYDPQADEYYIYKTQIPLTKGLWIRDGADSLLVQGAYRVTSKLHTTIYLELGLLVGVLFALFALVIYLIYKQRQLDKRLR